MRVVSHAEFLTMPAGTLFTDWDPYAMGTLRIKGETLDSSVNGDWWEHQLLEVDGLVDGLEDLDDGKIVRLDPDIEGRDGMNDSSRWFVVFDQEDVTTLIEKLKRCLQ